MNEGFLQVTLPTFLEDNHTCPQLAHTLIDAIASDLHDSKFPTFRNRQGANENKFRALHQTQAYVGWSQLFQGRLVQDWSRLQEEFLATNIETLKLDRRYYTGALWTRKLISLLWVTMRAQWDSRNADRHGHGHTTAENHAIRHARLRQEITAQYHDAPTMLAADRALFEEPIEQKLKQHPNRLALWLKRTKPIVQISKADATAAIHRTTDRLTKFFRIKRKKKPAATPGHPVPNQPQT
jgi:hypothetical protein